MDVRVDQRCTSCGTGIHCDAELMSVSGVGLLREMTAEWACPECEFEYTQVINVDMTMIERSGFESWVGSVGGDPLCLVVTDGEAGDPGHNRADVVKDKRKKVRENQETQSGGS